MKAKCVVNTWLASSKPRQKWVGQYGKNHSKQATHPAEQYIMLTLSNLLNVNLNDIYFVSPMVFN